jgi:MFS superfamily sulfate permease-like transporter
VELVDLAGMKLACRWRSDEFFVAAITALVVVVVGVEEAIILAIVLSIVDHLRRGYRPKDALLVRDEGGRVRATTFAPETVTLDIVPGLAIHRFTASRDFANANLLAEEVRAIVEREGGPPAWLRIDAGAIEDVDFSGGQTLPGLHGQLKEAARGSCSRRSTTSGPSSIGSG